MKSQWKQCSSRSWRTKTDLSVWISLVVRPSWLTVNGRYGGRRFINIRASLLNSGDVQTYNRWGVCPLPWGQSDCPGLRQRYMSSGQSSGLDCPGRGRRRGRPTASSRVQWWLMHASFHVCTLLASNTQSTPLVALPSRHDWRDLTWFCSRSLSIFESSTWALEDVKQHPHHVGMVGGGGVYPVFYIIPQHKQ